MGLKHNHVLKAANEVQDMIAKGEHKGYGLKDCITEVWELDPEEIDQVVAELKRRGHSDPVQ